MTSHSEKVQPKHQWFVRTTDGDEWDIGADSYQKNEDGSVVFLTKDDTGKSEQVAIVRKWSIILRDVEE